MIQHLGDLEYVLSKRASQDIREFEVSQVKDSNKKKEANKKSTPAKKELSYDERKTINKKISKAEKAIARLEKELTDINDKLMDVNFYNSPEGTEALKSIKTKETELEKANEEWDKWVTELGE